MTDARTLTATLGGKWSGGSGMARCPAHNDRKPSLSIKDGATGRLLLHCHAGCEYRDILGALRDLGVMEGGGFRRIGPILRAEREEAERVHNVKRTQQALNVWSEAMPIAGTLAERYVRSRGINCPLPASLRYMESCWHQTARRLPAMMSLINTIQGNACAIHRTYLSADGKGKAEVFPCKVMLGPAGGGAVRLSAASGPLVVAEGIETALSLLSGIFPHPASVWAALSAGGMKALRLPPLPGELVVAPDGDRVGREAAEALATRAHALGWRVSLFPAPDGFDWNDVLTGKAVMA